MLKRTISTLAAMVCLASFTAWAQPPDFADFPGDERPQWGRWQGKRFDRMAEYLELSESQASEWQTLVDEHTETGRARWERIGTLREEFRRLADTVDPDLDQLGQIALDMHREMETARSSQGQLLGELEAVLTPEQADRFEALKAAREFAGPRHRRGPRAGHAPPDSN